MTNPIQICASVSEFTELKNAALRARVDGNNFYGMITPDGNLDAWVRTTTNGIIPCKSGGASSLGTPSWPFTNVYANNIYQGGTKVSVEGHTHTPASIGAASGSNTMGIWRDGYTGASTRMFYLGGTVANSANTARNGHACYLYFGNDSLWLYDSTAGSSVWSVSMNGHTHAASAITNLGTLYNATGSNLNLTANVDTVVNSAGISLPAGTYVVTASGAFPNNGSTASLRQVAIGPSSSVYIQQRIQSVYWNRIQCIWMGTLSSTTTLYAKLSSNVAHTGCSSTLTAIRIK